MNDSTIVITGLGLVTALGTSAGEVWERVAAGKSGIGPLRVFEPGGYACTASAEVPAFDLAPALRQPKNEKFMGPSVRCALRAAIDAVAASGIDLKTVDPFRIAVYTGSGQTGLESADFFDALEVAAGEHEDYLRGLGGRASRLIDKYFSLRTLANAAVGLLSTELGAQGASGNFVQGDTASALALASAYHDLLERRCDVAIAGGCESLLNVSTYLAYDRAGLLSPSPPDVAYRPFDRARDGIVLGEGAGFLVLERLDEARRRGAPVLGELAGVGFATEPIDSASPKRFAPALESAVRQAAGSQRIDFVVAHGIGTPDGDRAEAQLLEALPRVPVTAFKAHTGYVGAATAAVEFALALLAARHKMVPPIARHAEADAGCALDLVTGAGRPLAAEAPVALCLAWSWSGQCSAMLARGLPS